MKFESLISSLLSSTTYGTTEQAMRSPQRWLRQEKSLYVYDLDLYNDCLEKLFSLNNKLSSRFSRKTVFDFIQKQIPDLKSREKLEVTEESLFGELLAVEARSVIVKSPISGIRLDSGLRKFSLGGYTFGYMEDLTIPISNEKGMFISITIEKVYDNNLAIQKAETAFLDFIRLIVFISGKLDKSIYISLGLPMHADMTQERMYVSTSSYHVTDIEGQLLSGNVSNKYVEKIPVNNPFFSENNDFNKLWSLLTKKINGIKVTDIESRLLNSALALGESAFTKDKKNSVIYTCMSVELMFSFDEVGFYQRSIGEKLSDVFTFIVGQDKETRREIAKLFKNVYRMRSAIVHGGDKELNDENLFINFLMRAAISHIMNNDKFKGVKNVGQIYEMLRDAQNSY
ncbi:hypothetical protein [Vibrio campbellii]